MERILFLKENEEKAVKTLKRVLAERFNLMELRVFGSKVRRDATSESDIDVMIELEEFNPTIESQIYDFIFEINLQNDSFISAIIFTKKEIEEGPLSESPLYKIIQKEGVLI